MYDHRNHSHDCLPLCVGRHRYTSGTTGNPKGAILTHAGLCSSVAASRDTMPFLPSDVHLSYLPLAHIFECGILCVMLFAGGRVGFSSGHIKKMNEDLVTLRPTAMFGVPRVFQRLYQVHQRFYLHSLIRAPQPLSFSLSFSVFRSVS